MTDQDKGQVTAGMRGASWDARLMSRPYQMVPYALGTADGQRTLGFLFTLTGKEKTVVSLMHPREMAITHYLVPFVLDAGCATGYAATLLAPNTASIAICPDGSARPPTPWKNARSSFSAP